MRSERHIEALQVAQACVELGARVKTASCVSGIGQAELRRVFFSGDRQPPCGRQPESKDWLFERAKLLGATEASMFAVIFDDLNASGISYANSLITAYRLYRNRCRTAPRVSFDRAFDIVCCLRGIWPLRPAELVLVRCHACGSRHLGPFAAPDTRTPQCPLCELLQRYHKDSRVRAAFKSRHAHHLDGHAFMDGRAAAC